MVLSVLYLHYPRACNTLVCLLRRLSFIYRIASQPYCHRSGSSSIMNHSMVHGHWSSKNSSQTTQDSGNSSNQSANQGHHMSCYPSVTCSVSAISPCTTRTVAVVVMVRASLSCWRGSSCAIIKCSGSGSAIRDIGKGNDVSNIYQFTIDHKVLQTACTAVVLCALSSSCKRATL